MYFFRLYISIYPKNIRGHNRSGVPPPEASVATESQSRPVPAPYRRGQSFSGGHLHHPGALHDEEGVVLPRGWGYVLVAMCLISLSLSRVLEVIRSWCIASFAIIVGSYDVFSPPLLSCNELSFPFEVILSDWVFKDLRTLDVCLAVDIYGDNGISRDSLDVCFGDQLAGSAHEPMHKGWHTFLSWLSGRNFGALFEVLCVGWIDESEIVWCISYNHTLGYLTWHWSI